MPLHNLQLLIRPTLGGLRDHHSFVSRQAELSLRSELFSDLILLTPDGPISCHQSLLVPLSPLLHTLLCSFPPYPGLVHTVLAPVKLQTVKNILQIIYRGKVSVMNRGSMEQVLAGLQVLGIHLPGLECYQAAGHTFTTSLPSHQTNYSLAGKQAENNNSASSSNNNNIPLPFSTISSLHSSIVQLPTQLPATQDVKPVLPASLPHPPPGLGALQLRLASQLFPLAIDESVQCSVAGCREQVSLRSLVDHFKGHEVNEYEAFKCDQCNKRFKHKKALEIHRIKDHNQFKENLLFINGESSTNKKDASDINKVVNEDNEGPTLKKRKVAADVEIPPQVAADLSEILPQIPSEASEPKTPLSCTLCQGSLSTEWHRHPRRHKCPLAIPRLACPSINAGMQAHCDLCSTPVPSGWHKPPSRHSCPAMTATAVTVPNISNSILAVPDLTVPSEKSQASTSSSKKRLKPASSRPKKKVTRFFCEKCSESFSSLVSLRTHYTISHYWDEITTQFSSWGSRCYICLRAFPSSNQLVRHMGNFHSFVDQCLIKDGLNYISVENTIKLLSLECGYCGEVKATSAELKNHLSYVHFSKELEREFPGETSVTAHKNKRCNRCGKMFNYSSVRIKHVGSFHDQVLKYAKQFITVDDGDILYIPENDFDEGADFPGEPFEDEDMAFLVSWEPLDVPKTHLLDMPGEDHSRLPKIVKVTGETSMSSSSKIIQDESSSLHPCPLSNCTRQCVTRMDLLVHLAMAHYLEQLEKQFGTSCGVSRCCECDQMLPSNKQGYLKHMAVEHEIVMTYVERDLALELSLSNAVDNLSDVPTPGPGQGQ